MRFPFKLELSWSVRAFDLNSMALPARVALWLGVLLTLYGFFASQIGLMLLGCAMIVVGAVVWWRFKPKEWVAKRRPSRDPNKRKMAQDKEKAALKTSVDRGRETLNTLNTVARDVRKSKPRGPHDKS